MSLSSRLESAILSDWKVLSIGLSIRRTWPGWLTVCEIFIRFMEGWKPSSPKGTEIGAHLIPWHISERFLSLPECQDDLQNMYLMLKKDRQPNGLIFF